MDIQGFCLVVHGFMLVFIFFEGVRSVFHGFSRFQVNFSWFKVVFHGFFYGSRSGFHDSRWILPSLMVPGWFKSELSAGGAK